MSQRLSNSFVNTNRPGSYFETNVKSTPVGVGTSGNIVIIGEAAGGADFSAESSFKNNFFTPDQLSKVVQKYTSGPIVDAFRALTSASSDAGITGSANRIYIAKTNAGDKAVSVLGGYGELINKNYGVDGNKCNYQITQVFDEIGPSIEGDVINNFALLQNRRFSIVCGGKNPVTIDVFTDIPSMYDTITKVVNLINSALPTGFSCVVGTGDSIKIKQNTDVDANIAGYGKSFELYDFGHDLSYLGLSAGLVVSSQEPKIQLDIKRFDTNTNESMIIDSDIALSIGKSSNEDTTLTIDNTSLKISENGFDVININLADYKTINDLSGFLNSQSNTYCSFASGVGQLSPTTLDKVNQMGIYAANAEIKPGRIKKALYNFKSKVSTSAVIDFNPYTTKGLPNETNGPVYLSNGAKGSTTAANVINAITACETINVNFVVPLFSRNATDDFAEGLTESDSTYTIEAVNAAVKSHVLSMSTAKVKKHRSAIVSFWNNSFEDVKIQSASLANARVSLVFQKSSQVNSVGDVISFAPWHTACIAAGMQAAGFYKAIVNKFANVISFTDPSGFDSGSNGDIETALDAGLLFLEQAIVGNKWVSDQTTYGVDTNFVYNSIQAMYAADLVSLDLAASFQNAFVGQSLADIDAGVALSFLASKMLNYKQQKLIAASSDTATGFKNAKVSINGPIMEVSVEIKLASAIYFIPISIDISQVTSSAA